MNALNRKKSQVIYGNGYIREAFKQLEAEGLIESVPNRGSFVLGFTKQDIQDIYAVRAAVEVLAIRWAVDRISESEIVKLQDELDLMEFYTKKRNGKKVLELNSEFHETLYNASGSRFMAQVLKSYQSYVQETRKATVYCEANLDTILEEHRSIFEAVRERDKEAAAARIATHLNNSQKRAENSGLAGKTKF